MHGQKKNTLCVIKKSKVRVGDISKLIKRFQTLLTSIKTHQTTSNSIFIQLSYFVLHKITTFVRTNI